MSLVQIGAPREKASPGPDFHVIPGSPALVFVVSGSRLYAVEEPASPDSFRGFEFAPAASPVARTEPDPRALSLNIAQSCNLACRYCYADQGRFGGSAQLMLPDVATKAIRRHIDGAGAGPVSIGFMGGEPLLNREVLHSATAFAAREAARRRVPISFSLTTNATLLREPDIDLLRSHGFAVNVSMDGASATHDALRPARNGQGSYLHALSGIAPLLAGPGNARVAARVTVTRRDLDIPLQIAALASAGFTEIGISPMRTGPDPSLRVEGQDWTRLLSAMKSAALADWHRVSQNRLQLRFSNFSTALRQIYRGACNALPCGAASDYVSVSADGHYYTCHRTVGDEAFVLGDLAEGPSPERRNAFVQTRAVDRQEPCRSCWARYLCGGGCHAEVMRVGRDGCDFIRGWLEFCISVYPEVLRIRPDLLMTKAPDRVSP